jgi:hypothetical protein
MLLDLFLRKLCADLVQGFDGLRLILADYLFGLMVIAYLVPDQWFLDGSKILQW